MTLCISVFASGPGETLLANILAIFAPSRWGLSPTTQTARYSSTKRPTPGPRSSEPWSPYSYNEAVTITSPPGSRTPATTESATATTNIGNGDCVKVTSILPGKVPESISIRVTSTTNSGKIELPLNKVTSTPVGTRSVSGAAG